MSDDLKSFANEYKDAEEDEKADIAYKITIRCLVNAFEVLQKENESLNIKVKDLTDEVNDLKKDKSALSYELTRIKACD